MLKLMVIVVDVLSHIIKKGEFTRRYYNPGNLFDEVHILMTNNDRPDISALQPTVGTAKLYLHNIPEPSLKRTLGYKPWLLNLWAKRAVTLAKKINPDMIRCHQNWLNGFLAYRIKKNTGIPYVVSLHTNPDEDIRKSLKNEQEIKFWNAMKIIENISLRNADLALPVYQSIIPYIENMGMHNYEVAYNVLNPEFLGAKTDYTLHNPVRLISVGRHFEGKNPENIIRAVRELPDVHLTLVGDGPYQDYLQNIAHECKVENRVTFHRAIPNNELCRQLPEYDIYVVHVESFGIAKAVLEPLLTGLPVIINRRREQPVPELQGDHVLLVENTPEGYYQGIKKLLTDPVFRENLGKRAYSLAQEKWAPARTEAKYVDIYKRILAKAK